MGIIVLFPSRRERRLKQFEEILDNLDFPNEELKKCVKDNGIAIFRKYDCRKLTIEFPTGLEQRCIEAISERIEQAITEYLFKLQEDMIHDLVKLQMEICLSRHA